MGKVIGQATSSVAHRAAGQAMSFQATLAPAAPSPIPVRENGARPGHIARPATGERTVSRAIRAPRLTVESGAYLLLLLAAALTRFWDLGTRALHHDESLHTYYSWLLYTGSGYTHDPLMHGPFLFHANALMYFLFGDNDATSRFVPALFGVALVGLPWLLRGPNFLGRWGALFTSALFLVSPSYLYYSRYIRHDMYTVVGSLVLFIAIVRYAERPRRGWLVLAGASLGFLFTNHEIVFALVAIFAGFLYGAMLFGPMRGLLTAHIAIGGIGLAAILAALTFGGAFPAIPWKDLNFPNESREPTIEQQRQFYIDLIRHPAIIVLVIVVIGAVVALRAAIKANRPGHVAEDGYVGAMLNDAPDGSFARGVANAWSDRPGLQWAVLAGLAVAVPLFSSMFTNLRGLMTATFATDGTLLYWLGQQDVQRGEQPWFYFLVMTPQYELLAIAFGLAAIGLTAWRVVKTPADPRQRFRLFLAVWFAGMFVGLSYAGEKMPWLIVHFTLPLTLLAGGLLGEVTERRIARTRLAGSDRFSWVSVSLVIGLLLAGASWMILAARLSFPVITENARGAVVRVVAQGALDQWWLLAIPPITAVVMVGAVAYVRGVRSAALPAIAALAIGLLIIQIHAGWRVSMREGDVARDSLIYNTTTPDVTRMVGELSQLSNELHGDLSMDVWFDDDTSWPLNWYLRDFTDRRYFGGSLDSPPSDAEVLIVSDDNLSDTVRAQLDGYTAQEYVLRWHEPEGSVYRDFAIAPEIPVGRSALNESLEDRNPVEVAGLVAESIASSISTQAEPEGQQRLWRLVMYREMPTSTINFGFTMYVRNDLVPLYNTIRY